MARTFPSVLFLFILFLLAFHTNQVYAADDDPPISVLTTTPSAPNGENDWYTVYPDVNISATDLGSGVSTLNWKINSGSWNTATFSSGINLLMNPSFESGFINRWSFTGPFPSVGIKSSFRKHSGNFSAVIINLSPIAPGDAYWRNTDYLLASPLQTYSLSFYAMSLTSWLDNGFYEVILDDGGVQTVLVREDNLDLKLNYKQYNGSFVVGDVGPNAYLFLKIGITGIGEISIDDAYLGLGGSNASVDFTLNQEGVNTVYYYATDTAGNIEDTKQQQIKVDTNPPQFTGFQTFNQVNLQTFASSIDVTDDVSKLVSSPALFNYSVDAINNGYYENYGSCSGNFIEDGYIDLNTNFSSGQPSGTVSTPVIDYCDTNWSDCKRLNFYVKDLAGNIGSHSICVNGPYIISKYGNVFARTGIYQMGLGEEPNLWGVGVSDSSIDNVNSALGFFVENYNAPYLNNLYTSYLDRLQSIAVEVTDISLIDGIYIIQNDYTISNPLDYEDSNQVVFINGDLNINSNITSFEHSSIFYLVNGDITVSNTVEQLEVNLISTNQFFTSDNVAQTERINIKGAVIAQDIVFSRSTDRTQGASEIVTYPIYIFFAESSPLFLSNIYWREVIN